jgi:transposase
MSTSLLYHAWGTTTYDYLRTEYRGGAIYLHVAKKPCFKACVVCKSHAVTSEGSQSYALRALPIGNKRVFLVVYLDTLFCKDCGAVRQESRDIADPRKTYTRAFARLVLDLLEEMTMSAVAKKLHIGWDMVKDILRSSLERKAERRSWSAVRRIAIDEIATQKGHKYLTVVVDLDTGQVLYTAPDNDKESLKMFFQRLRRSRAKLRAIAVDMSQAYASAIRDYWPKPVAVVHDHFHVVSNMNKVVEEVRREEQNRLEAEGQKTLKGARYLLLWAAERLAKDPDKKSRLDKMLAANDLLHKVYLLKEDLRMFWRQPSLAEARSFVKQWVVDALALGNKHMTRFATTVKKHLGTILAWYKHPITSGPLEGLNNKIKVLKRKAYGYRDVHFFGLRLLFIHETKFSLSGV